MLKSHHAIGVGVAGADKLLGNRAYESMFRHLGWTHDQMRQVAPPRCWAGC